MASTPPSLTSGVGTTLLLFGPQALSFTAESLQTLRKLLVEADDCKWLLEVVSELPTRWHELAKEFPKLERIPGERLLNDLKRWFHDDPDKGYKATSQLPNILLTPLVVLTQLAHFARYLSYSPPGASVHVDHLFRALAQGRVETVGLCTGLLSASAVSSASDAATFRQYGTVAVRLAMVIGALVDCQDGSDKLHGPSKSFALAWASPDMANDLVRVLDGFPEVRTACRVVLRVAKNQSLHKRSFAGVHFGAFRREPSNRNHCRGYRTPNAPDDQTEGHQGCRGETSGPLPQRRA